jgi:hypothetical protein
MVKAIDAANGHLRVLLQPIVPLCEMVHGTLALAQS